MIPGNLAKDGTWYQPRRLVHEPWPRMVLRRSFGCWYYEKEMEVAREPGYHIITEGEAMAILREWDATGWSPEILPGPSYRD